ncbi:uncharacterized protein [Eurosta solidaginis]|uniref:uncharacterized protein n=1 Tax=Eurosta solidaginis TaxID=178769 RepID=UPI003530B45C
MDVAAFIAEVRKRERLWNRKTIYPNSKERLVGDVLWQEIANKFNISRDKAKSKWRCLRDTFVKMKKAAAMKGNEKPTWVHYKSMSFMLDRAGYSSLHSPKRSDGKKTASPQSSPSIISVSATEATFPNIDEVYTISQDSFTNLIQEEQPSMKNATRSSNPVLFVDGPPPLVMIEPKVSNVSVSNIKRVYTLQDEENNDLNLSDVQQYNCLTKKVALKSGLNHSDLQQYKEIADDNEILTFFRSLLPFMNKLDIIQQLRTRMRFQEILLDEFRT